MTGSSPGGHGEVVSTQRPERESTAAGSKLAIIARLIE